MMLYRSLVEGDDFDPDKEPKKLKGEFFKKAEFDLIGYCECDIDDAVLIGKIMFQVSANVFTIHYNSFLTFGVVIVPVTAKIDMSVKGSAALDCQYDWKHAEFIYSDFSIDASASLKAFGGIGYGDVAGVGAYGNAVLAAQLLFSSHKCGINYLYLEGELGLKAYLGPLEAHKTFAKKDGILSKSRISHVLFCVLLFHPRKTKQRHRQTLFIPLPNIRNPILVIWIPSPNG